MSKMLIALLAVAAVLLAPGLAAAECAAALDFEKRRLAGGERVRLCDEFGGRVVLVVNTASKCAFTPQYEGLEALHERLGPRGLSVIGFPSNDFGGQEPGSEAQIQSFCRLTYGVDFPMFEKTRVVGAGADPLYRHLADATGEAPGWNFHKYLIDRDGRVVRSFSSRVRPESAELVEAIEALL